MYPAMDDTATDRLYARFCWSLQAAGTGARVELQASIGASVELQASIGLLARAHCTAAQRSSQALVSAACLHGIAQVRDVHAA
jgi:hypothetical protein